MSKLLSAEFVIRKMSVSDVENVVKLCNDNGIQSWGEKDFENELKIENSISLIVENAIKEEINNENIVGFLLARVLQTEAEVLNIAVADKFRRKAIGSALIDILVNELKKVKVETIWLEVRAANIPAIRLYEKKGFVEAGRRHSYYSIPTEDAILMSRNCV